VRFRLHGIRISRIFRAYVFAFAAVAVCPEKYPIAVLLLPAMTAFT
jgi:hypothetical protein